MNLIYENNFEHFKFPETLRKYPAKPFLIRSCTKNYVLPQTNDIMMKKDSIVYVSILGIHHNPVYYPNPLQFQPERFAEQEYEDATHYLPFGIGPRKCYGQKLAIMIMKCTLAQLVSQYDFQTIPGETIEEVDFQLLNFMSQSHEINVKIAPRSVPETDLINEIQIVETLTTDEIPIRKDQIILSDTPSTSSCALMPSTSGSRSVEAERTISETIASEITSTVCATDEMIISESESKPSCLFPFPSSIFSSQLKLSPKKEISAKVIESNDSIESTIDIISIPTTPRSKPKPLQMDIREVPLKHSKEATISATDVKHLAAQPSSFNTFNRFIPRSPTKSAKFTPTKTKEKGSPPDSPTVFHIEVEVHHSPTNEKVDHSPKK